MQGAFLFTYSLAFTGNLNLPPSKVLTTLRPPWPRSGRPFVAASHATPARTRITRKTLTLETQFFLRQTTHDSFQTDLQMIKTRRIPWRTIPLLAW